MTPPVQLAFALITFYPYWYAGDATDNINIDKVRGDLAIEFIEKASQKGYRLVVVDGKSFNSFHQALQKISGIKLLRRESDAAAPAKRLAVRTAAHLKETKVIITTEPEKIDLLSSIDQLVLPIINNEADVVVPARRLDLFKESYPDFQFLSETRGNQVYNQRLRQAGLLTKEMPDLDIFFGPRLLRNDSKVIKAFLDEINDSRDFSAATALPILSALAPRLRVKSVEIPFRYPALQKQNELANREFFMEKRAKQYRELISELNRFFV